MRAATVMFLTLATLPTLALADVVETFDTTSADWLIVSYPFRSHVANPATQPASFDAAFGNPAGSLRVGDIYAETGVAAPVVFLGDKSSYYGGSFGYDIYIRYVDAGAIYPAVVLNGGTMSVYYDTPTPPLDAWESRAIPLTETGWRLSSSGADVDQATFRAILADLHGLYVYTEWRTGPDDTSFDNARLITAPVGVDDATPRASLLRPCYPNPFNPGTTVRFALEIAGPVRVSVIAADGRLVRELVADWRDAGDHAVYWDGRDGAGRAVASGTYLCRLEAGGRDESSRMTLVK